MKRSLFLSVAPIALISIATPAFAQTAAADAPAAAQEAAGDQSAEAPKTDEDAKPKGDAIVVTGIRQSLRSSQAIKRNSDSILDAIVAEDIGKLPDVTAAESIARIAGVQVTRFSDEANGILIRGLPDVATSYNGREIFTAELRRVQLMDFPAQAIQGLEVYKSGTADIIEPGLAGLVNVRTRRPFDFKGRMIGGGVRGTYNDQSRKKDLNGNILFSDRWKVGDGEMGFLANATYAQQQYYNGVRYNSTWIRDTTWSTIDSPGVDFFHYPNNIGLYNDGGKRVRPSANFALQWAPNSDLDIYVEGIWQGYRGETFADNFDVPLELWGPGGNRPVFTNVTLLEGTDQAETLTKTEGSDPQGYRNTGKDQTNTFQIASGAKWQRGSVILSTDLAYSWSRYNRDRWSVDFRTRGARTVDVDFNRDGGVAFNFPNWDPFNADNYIFRGYWNETYDVKGAGLQWRGDAKYDTGLNFLPVIQAGLRLTDRTSQQVKYGSRYADVSDAQIPFADLPVGDLVRTTDPFRGNAQGFTQYLSIPYTGIVNNAEALRQFTYNALVDLIAAQPNNQYFKDRLAEFSTEDIQTDPSQGWKGKERTYAAYLQGKYKFSVGAIDVDGVVGVRVVKTDGSTHGVSTVCLLDPDGDSCTMTKTPRTEKQQYTDVLPNASMRIKLKPELQLRLGYTQTRTKPEFRDLNPALFINPVYYDDDAVQIPGRTYPNYTGSSGNPGLKPFTSNNYDASLEYYFSSTGFVSAAAFYRDLYGFTTWVTRFRDDPTYGTLQLSSPINAADGKIKGLEFNAQTFLDFLPRPWNGFGVSGNLTLLKGKSRYPNGYNPETDQFEGPGQYLKIPGLSKVTYNLAVFYEKGPIQARVSYNRRSDWVNWYSQDPDSGDQYTGSGTHARDRLDASISYDVTKNFTLNADFSNILAKPFNNYVSYAPGRTFPIDVRDEGRYYGLGLRFRFGE